MKILHWTPAFLPNIGGTEILVAQLLSGLRECDYESIVVTSHGRDHVADKTLYQGIPVHRFHFLSAISQNNLRQIMAIRSQIVTLKNAFQPDLVHLHFNDPSAYFHFITANIYPTRTLVTVHHLDLSVYRNKENNTLLDRIFRMADWVTTVSRSVLSEIQQLKPMIKGRSSYIYNGLSMPTALPAPLPVDAPRILCVGRLEPNKNFRLVIQAFALLVRRFPHARLTIIGVGPLQNILEQQAASLDLEDKVIFPGRIPLGTMPEWMNQANMLVVSSYLEGFSLVALEAAQMARPVIATRIPAVTEVVLHEKTGLIVDHDDPQGLADAMMFIFTHPERAKLMGEAGRVRAKTVFTLEHCVEAYDRLYHQLFETRSQTIHPIAELQKYGRKYSL